MEEEAKQRVLSRIMASPFRIDIMSNLSGAVSGLPFQALVQEERKIQQHLNEEEIRSRLERNLKELLVQQIVMQQGQNYFITKYGLDLYKIVQEVAAETSKA
jgi:hypothetical protein